MKRTLAFLLLLFSCARAEPRKLNVLLVTLDTFRADRLGAPAPNLVRLAAGGIRFEQAQSPAPLTLPAHASILSALLPLHHGLRTNGVGVLPQDQDTLATVLSARGYRTGAFVGAFVLDRRFGLSRGFDTYDDAIARDPNSDLTLEAERRGAEVVDRALAWMSAGGAQPSFTWVHLWDAHAPYAPPQPYPRTYDGEVAYVDAQLGRLLAVIDRSNTIVVVTGDHGESLGAHGELTHGLLLHQPTLHVPLIIAFPDVEPGVVREAVSTVDIAPTVASLAGAVFPPRDGRDLAEFLRNGTPVPRSDLYAETQYPLTFGWSELASLRRGPLELIAGPVPELYDLGRDPRETNNLAAESRRAFRELASALEALRRTAMVATPVSMDEETKAKLASLGYAAPGPAPGAGARPNPKAMAPLFAEFERALEALGRNDLRAAEAALSDLVRRDPANAVFRSTLARVRRQLGSGSSAVALYRQAVALAPRDADTWFNLGMALSECCDRKEARAALMESARLDPRRASTHNALGILAIEEGNTARAEEEFRRAVEADPRDPRAWNNTGNATRATGRIDQAMAAYRKAIELAPGYADPLNGLGVLLVQQHRAVEAIPFFDRALRLQPDFHEAQLNRGIALQESGDRQGAAKQYRALLDRLPPGAASKKQRDAAMALLAMVDTP